MNQAEKEAYLREYSNLKNQGKPFFPYAVAKDSVMAVIVMIVIMLLALMFGAALGPARSLSGRLRALSGSGVPAQQRLLGEGCIGWREGWSWITPAHLAVCKFRCRPPREG